MDQNDNSQNGFLYTLLANPATGASACSGDLQRLVTDNPQSGLLQALLVHASDEKNLKRASAYFNPKLLYKLINNPSSFNNVDEHSIYIQPALRKNNNSYAGDTFRKTESEPAQPNFNNYFSEEPAREETVEGAPLTDQLTELNPIEDTDVAEHRLDEQITADTGATEAILQDDEQEIKPVEFHPGLENLMTFEESTAIQHEATGGIAYVAAVDYAADVIETIPQSASEKENEKLSSTSTYLVDVAMPIGQVDDNADISSQNISQAAEAMVGAKPEQTVEGSYSGPGLIDLNHFANPQHITPVQETVAEKQPLNETAEPVADIEKPAVKEHLAASDIDDDVYDEIMGIEHIQLNSTATSPLQNEQTEPVANVDEEENRLIVENIAATDFFMFDDAFGNHKGSGPSETGTENSNETVTLEHPLADEAVVEPDFYEPVVVPAEAYPVKEEQQDVSKYNDDKMPYTFMWWLDKTRREHAGVSQPYAEKKAPEAIVEKKNDDVLQQQYYSNIFHITSVEELSKDEASKPFSFGVKKRSQQIIEKFIKEEPQIRPQSSDKLDNENKAKKSSEDRDEIVTETLAAIYTEQMLYYKAIAAYKKLMFKFPEKSSYFADKVEQLSKKIN